MSKAAEMESIYPHEYDIEKETAASRDILEKRIPASGFQNGTELLRLCSRMHLSLAKAVLGTTMAVLLAKKGDSGSTA